MNRRKLLFLSHRLPFPPHNGAAIRTFNILKLLEPHYDITALCFDRRDSATARIALDDRIAAISLYGATRVFSIPQQLSRSRLLWDHARSLLSGQPYTTYVHRSRPFSLALAEELARNDFDVIHVDSIDLLAHLEVLPPDKVVLTHHNVESILLDRRATADRELLRRRYLKLQAGRVARAETQWAERVALNVMVSEQDEADLRRMAPAGRYAVVPNGVDIEYFTPRVQGTDGMVFVGGTGYYPNLDALQWFAGDILPRLRALGIADEAVFVGRATDAEQTEYSTRMGLRLTGYVPDVRPFLGAARCFIAPLRVGGGTRLKLLDAWAMGKAIVSTSLGAEGLAYEDGENIVIADSASAFAERVRDILSDRALRERLERNARKIALARYSWDVIGAAMIAAYATIGNRASA